MEVAELAPRREVVSSWNPDAVRVDSVWIGDGAAFLDARSSALDERRIELREVWGGAASDAAADRLTRDVDDARRRSADLRTLERVVRDRASDLARAHADVFAAVAAAEVAGCVVTSEWAVVSTTDDGAGFAAVVAQRVRALVDADEAGARAIDAASAALVGDGPRRFVPLAIGLAWAIEAAVNALIAAGVLSVGAMAFALVDRFGMDAWDTIHDALPNSFFQDAGPVDAAGVEDVLNDLTEPGRTYPHRQVDSEEEVRQVLGSLTQDARAVDPGTNGKILEKYVLPDGTRIQLRTDSRSGGLTIDINTDDDNTTRKVHVR